jgi:hypothetical protein
MESGHSESLESDKQWQCMKMELLWNADTHNQGDYNLHSNHENLKSYMIAVVAELCFGFVCHMGVCGDNSIKQCQSF